MSATIDQDPIYGPTNPDGPKGGISRFGSVIELRPDMEKRYRQLHAATWPAVLNRMHRSCIRNFSIFVGTFAGKRMLFSYFEYFGDDYTSDTRKIAEDPATREWWKLTDACQQRLPGTPEGDQWLGLESVFFARLTAIEEVG